MVAGLHTRAIAIIVAVALTLGGCATGNPGEPKTALDRSVGDCVASVAVGALVGALLGAAAGGRRSVGTGAAIGAGAGTVACAVIVAMNNKQDRERIQQARLAALKSGHDETQQYVGSDGTGRVIHTSVQPASLPASKPAAIAGNEVTGPCRRAQTQITVAGKGTAQLDPELVCQTAAGDWVAIDNKKTV